jgi:hypothetical protein
MEWRFPEERFGDCELHFQGELEAVVVAMVVVDDIGAVGEASVNDVEVLSQNV